MLRSPDTCPSPQARYPFTVLVTPLPKKSIKGIGTSIISQVGKGGLPPNLCMATLLAAKKERGQATLPNLREFSECGLPVRTSQSPRSLVHWHIDPFKSHVRLFRSQVTLFRSHIGLFRSHISLLKRRVGLFRSHVTLFRSQVALFRSQVSVFKSHVGQFRTHIMRLKSQRTCDCP